MSLGINLGYVVNALIFSILGLLIFGVGFIVIDKITPYRLWDEIIKEKNLALAIVVGSLAIAMGLIIASAIHG